MRIDLTGKRFGRLIVTGFAGLKRKAATWFCSCDCGGISTVISNNLRRGITRSCGCLKRDSNAARTHGMCRTRPYRIWAGMKNRCHNPKAYDYAYYGARGICVCERWRHSFENFIEDMGLPTTDHHSIERINNDGNYEPSNCRWATQQEQVSNSRHCRMLTHNGVTMTLSDWSRKSGVNRLTLTSRVIKLGWPIGLAIETPNISNRSRLRVAK